MTVLTVLTRRFRRLVACLAGIAALFLAGCEVDGTIEFQADGRVLIDLTVEDSDGTMTKIEQTCDNFRVMFLGQVKFVRNPKIEDVTPPGGHTTCRVTSNEPFVGGFGFKETKNTYSFVFPNNRAKVDYSDFKTRIIITMPGKILSSNKGKINGNKVIVNSLDFANTGISITAQKEGQGTPSGESSGSSVGGSGVSSSSGSGGFPVWGWVGVGAGAVVVVAVVAFGAGRGRRTASGLRQGGPGVGSGVR